MLSHTLAASAHVTAALSVGSAKQVVHADLLTSECLLV